MRGWKKKLKINFKEEAEEDPDKSIIFLLAEYGQEAKFLAALKKAALRELSKVPATAVRLFVCGDAYAGKTTLLSTLCSLGLQKSSPAQDSSQSQLERTLGIQVHALERDGIRLSTWDMAGQPEFQAFHDHMIPDPSNSSAMFMFVWSSVNSKDESKGAVKEEDAFKDSLSYWLRFIAAKTQHSRILHKIIVVLTRQDQVPLMKEALQKSIEDLKTSFAEIFQVVGVFEVDARSPDSVHDCLLPCIFQTAKDVLEGVEIYEICASVSEYLATEPTIKDHGPLMPWDSFTELCKNRFNVSDHEIQKAIAYSLNESGCLIYLSNLPFLVLDPNWFCNVVMGRLIHFTSEGYIPIRGGYVGASFLEAMLERITQKRVKVHLLMDLLEVMHVFCRVDADADAGDGDGKVFVPSTLVEKLSLKWRGTNRESFSYAGTRLECDRKDLTFLTPGFFHMIQVLFHKVFLETKAATVQLGKSSIFICKENLQIIVEWALAKREHVIDVMVCAPHKQDTEGTVHDLVNKILISLARVCAQPIGNQGVRLVESVIRPDCLRDPVPSDVREDQCALMVDLKKELRRKLQDGKPWEKLVHVWDGRPLDDAKSVYNHFIDLLGDELYNEELLSYERSLQDASKMVQCSSEVGESESLTKNVELGSIKPTDGCTVSQVYLFESGSTSTLVPDHLIEESTETPVSDGMTEESLQYSVQLDKEDAPFEVAVIRQLVRQISQVKCEVKSVKCDVKSVHGKLDVMNDNLESVKCDVKSVHGKVDVILGKLEDVHRSAMELRKEVLHNIQNSVERFLNFAVENERGRVPRFVFLTTEGVGFKRRVVTALFSDVTSVRIELFCEHRGGPHRVTRQEGLCVSWVKGETFLKKALPYVQGFLKVLTLLLKVGAHVVAGLPESTIPDFSKVIALALDTPGFLESEELLAKLDALALDSDLIKDFLGWEEWLVSQVMKKKGPKQAYSGIHKLFGLRRRTSKDLKVAWLCDTHFKSASL